MLQCQSGRIGGRVCLRISVHYPTLSRHRPMTHNSVTICYYPIFHSLVARGFYLRRSRIRSCNEDPSVASNEDDNRNKILTCEQHNATDLPPETTGKYFHNVPTTSSNRCRNEGAHLCNLVFFSTRWLLMLLVHRDLGLPLGLFPAIFMPRATFMLQSSSLLIT